MVMPVPAQALPYIFCLIFNGNKNNESKKATVRLAVATAACDVGKNVSATALARRIGVSPQAMSKFISGRCDPSLERLHQIADALDVRVRDLFRD